MRGARGRGRGGLAPPLPEAVGGVHVNLQVLARLEGLGARGAAVRALARRVHVQQVLLQVAAAAVALAAGRARGPPACAHGPQRRQCVSLAPSRSYRLAAALSLARSSAVRDRHVTSIVATALLALPPYRATPTRTLREDPLA